MKKLCFALCALFAFVSCTDNNTTEPEVPQGATTYSVTYSLPEASDLIELCDVTVDYVDADGTTKTVEVTSIPWEHKIADVEAPFEAKVSFTVVKKNPFPELTRASYTLSEMRGILVMGSNGSVNSLEEGITSTVEASQVEELVEFMAEELPYTTSISI